MRVYRNTLSQRHDCVGDQLFYNHLDQEKSLVFMEKSTAIQGVTRAKVDEPSDDRLDCGKKSLNTPESSHHTSSPYSERFFII